MWQQIKKLQKRFSKNKNFIDDISFKVVAVLALFLLLHLILPIQTVNAMADNFNKVAIGSAALLTVYFGSSYVREEISRKRAIEFYKSKYPPEKYKKKYRIIESENAPGAIYLHDLESLHKHHIWNMLTVYDLGWQSYPRESLKHSEFLSILNGDPIRTRGDLGQ
jgi:hypothetical protein